MTDTLKGNQPVALTTEQLIALVREIKEPVVTEQMKKEHASQQEARQQEAAQYAEMHANKIAMQLNCTHLRRDGTCRAVFIQNGNYLLCQKCQAVIRQGTAPAKDNAMNAIYDTALFNRLFQQTSTAQIND